MLSYLEKQASKFEDKADNFLLFIVSISFSVGYILGGNNPSYNPYVLFTAAIFLAAISSILISKRDKFKKISENYNKGSKGEEYIIKKLEEEKTSSNFNYIHNIDLGYGDTDFLIVNDRGVFCIEIKSITGEITYDNKNNRLLYNFKPFDRDYLKQVKRTSVIIRNIIKDKIPEFNYVQPILVFSALGSNLKKEEKIGDVYVFKVEGLLQFLKQRAGQNLSKDDQEIIYQLMLDYKESKDKFSWLDKLKSNAKT